MGVKPHFLLSLALQPHLARSTYLEMASQAQSSTKVRKVAMSL